MDTDKKAPQASGGDAPARDPSSEEDPPTLSKVARAAFERTRGMSLGQTLRELGVSEPIARAAGRVYVADSGALVVTVPHEEIERDLDGSHVHWIDAVESRVGRVGMRPVGPTVLQRVLMEHVGRPVYVVLLKRSPVDAGFATIERAAPDAVLWRLEQASEWFVLRRPGVRRPRCGAAQNAGRVKTRCTTYGNTTTCR